MTQRLFVTLGSRQRKDRVLLEIPGDQPVQEMMRDLAHAVGWKEFEEVPSSTLSLETEEGDTLPENQTLSEAGISGSDLLFLVTNETQPSPAIKREAEGEPNNAWTPRGIPIGSEHVLEILRQPRLVGPRGLMFILGKSRIVIGRSGKGITPDIDLSEWDAKMISSRKHALIESTQDGFSLRSEKTTNSTFVNRVELPAGESRILRDGDRILFGFQGLELVFKERGK
jgi:hypothetical protein